MPVESEISACPAEGLASVTFFAGKPPGGDVISPRLPDGKSEKTVWDFSNIDDSIYMSCSYTDGFERMQRLPNQTKSCRMSKGGALTCTSWI